MRVFSFLVFTALTLTFLVGSSANAGVIAVDDPVWGVGSFTRDTDQGLDFLDPTITAGLSWSDVHARTQAGQPFEGLQIATFEQVATLINHSGFSPRVPTTPFDGTVTGDTGGDQFSQLLGLTGVTFQSFGAGPRQGFNAFVGQTAPGSVARTITVTDFFEPSWNDRVSSFTASAFDRNAGRGTFLVRSSAAAVPEPASLALWSLGAIVGLTSVTRRRRHA